MVRVFATWNARYDALAKGGVLTTEDGLTIRPLHFSEGQRVCMDEIVTVNGEQMAVKKVKTPSYDTVGCWFTKKED